MKINQNENMCSACGACMAVCPVGAIHMVENEKGFPYPKIEEKKCVECGKCRNVCPVDRQPAKRELCNIYALVVRNQRRRMESRSGGAFSALAETMLEKGGIVYGVWLTESFAAEYCRVTTKEELGRLKGSKYVEAKTNTIFLKVKKDLEEGREVLFCGTSCHVAGLYAYLGDEYRNLLTTCDLICHGVPSAKLFRDYIGYISKGESISDYNFRNKTIAGWHRHIESYRRRTEVKTADEWTKLFYSNYFLRESCYRCKYASLNKPADITLGDFWGIEKVYPALDDNRGVSVVIVHSNHGMCLMAQAAGKVRTYPANAEQIMQPNLVAPSGRPDATDEMWDVYCRRGFCALLRRSLAQAWEEQISKLTLGKWLMNLERGICVADYFAKRGCRRIALLGAEETNRIVMSEFMRMGITDVSVISSEQDLNGAKFDKILITDEAQCSDLLEWLKNNGVSMNDVVTLGWIVFGEV